MRYLVRIGTADEWDPDRGPPCQEARTQQPNCTRAGTRMARGVIPGGP